MNDTVAISLPARFTISVSVHQSARRPALPLPRRPAAPAAVHRRADLVPLALHLACGALTLLFLLLAAPAAPARTAAGVYFTLVLIPAIQLILWLTLGWRASLAAGVAVASLTGLQSLLPPRPPVIQLSQWRMRFTAPDQAIRARLAPPPNAQASRLLASGGTATLHLCRYGGALEDLRISLGATPLTDVRARPNELSCWLQLAVGRDLIPSPPAPVEVTLSPAAESWTPESSPTLTGGYTRPPSAGGRSGGALFFDGGTWSAGDLSPSQPGAQTGRYYVELRIADATGRVREVWY